MHYFFLSLLGLFVGTAGTLIGAGGGFLVMPILVLLYPDEPPNLLASISLAVVCLNACSGSVAYARLKRIDYRSGCIFSAAALPGSIVGALATSYLSIRLFDLLLGTVMVLIAIVLFVHGRRAELVNRSLKDGTFRGSYRLSTGILISIAVGFFSSLLGIGGGIIHVPAMVLLLNFPVPVATATSHFILAIVSFGGTMVHVFSGVFVRGLRRLLAISIGVVVGAQVGARLSHRVSGPNIVRTLAAALGLVGLRVIAQALRS